ncbi:MAG: (Fe-S)-binding protein [Pseudomonadota bacterium]
MLLKSYQKKIFRAECNASFESLHLKAKLEQNIEAVLPYLNAVLGGFQYFKDPPAVLFKSNGRLITVQGKEIAINALKDYKEADKIFAWLVNEINTIWEERETIEPVFEGMPKPKIIEILKLLPKTNCKKCGQPTCMVFAARVAEGIYGEKECPQITKEDQGRLDSYMEPFMFH